MCGMKKLEAQKTLKAILAFGADSEEDDGDESPPSPGNMPPRRRNRNQSRRRDDEDDDEEDDSTLRGGKYSHIQNEKDRRIAELNDESAKRRHKIRDLRHEIEDLAEQLEEAKRFKTRYEKLESKYNDLESGAKLQAIRNAILSNENVKFHDTEMVMGLLDQSSISVDLKDGSIGGLEDQITKISADRPFLVKEAKAGSEGDQQGQQQQSQRQQTPPPSGTPPQSSATGSRPAKETEAEMNKKMLADFPAMSSIS